VQEKEKLEKEIPPKTNRSSANPAPRAMSLEMPSEEACACAR